MIPLLRDEFWQWLSSLARDCPVGRANSFAACPLATYLRVRGAPAPEIAAGDWTYCLDCEDANAEEAVLASWAIAFIGGVDLLRDQQNQQHPITAYEALRVLNGSGEQ